MPGTEWTDIVTSRSRTISALSLDPIHPIHPIHGGRANGRESNADCFGGTAGFYLTLLCDAGTAWTGEGVVLPKAVTRAGVCRSVCRVSSGLFQRPFRHPPVFPIFYFLLTFVGFCCPMPRRGQGPLPAGAVPIGLSRSVPEQPKPDLSRFLPRRERETCSISISKRKEVDSYEVRSHV